MKPTFLGLDCGTSGLRAQLIDLQEQILFTQTLPFIENTPEGWTLTLVALLDELGQAKLSEALRDTQIVALSLDATSSTLFLVDAQGHRKSDWRMYHQSCSSPQVITIQSSIPKASIAHGYHSSLAKVIDLASQSSPPREPLWICHQADWLNGHLTGQWGLSDWNNALKLGWDAQSFDWPVWLAALLPKNIHLPNLLKPGTFLGLTQTHIHQKLRETHPIRVYAGTTDSIAAYHAARATRTQGVTSLGSSLVIKQWSDKPIQAPDYGIYSHWYQNGWLVGGASNTGGQVLKAYFTPEELTGLSKEIPPENPSGLDYYPLLKAGERFPINDPTLAPQLTPRPESDAAFLHGLLEGMARIESKGYALLHRLGAPRLEEILTSGGGSKNPQWTAMRQRLLGIKVKKAAQSEAAFGMALWAKDAYTRETNPR